MSEAQPTQFVTADECAFLAACMDRKYAHQLDGRKFQAEAAVQGDGVYVKVILRNDDDSFHYPVEARIKYEHEEMTKRKAALFLIDYIDIYFEEFLEEAESLFLPIDWADHEYDAIDFQIRGQILNLKVEAMADKLLEDGVPYQGPNIII